MRQEFVSGVWHFATGGGNEWAGRNLVANAPPVELLQEVARGVGMCNWVRWEAGDCKGGRGRWGFAREGKAGGVCKRVVVVCGGFAGGRETRVLIRYFVWCNSFLFGNNSFCRPLAQASGTACNLLLRILSRVRCRLRVADYLARVS